MKANFQDVPVIDVTPLFSPDGSDRNEVDKAIGLACERVGFFVISGAALQEFSSPYRIERLLRFFQLNAGQLLPMARKRYVPANLNAYRGYFPTTDGDTSYKHGIDLGPEFDSDDPYYPRGHPLVERNLWPDEADLPGWRTDILAYYADMLRLGRMLMHSVARYLGLIENWFDQSFAGTNSTLRLLRYPVRTAESLKGIGERAYVVWTSPGLMDSSYCTNWRVLYEQVQIKDSDSIYRGVSPTDGGAGPSGSQAQATVAGVWLHRMVDPTLVQPG
jgi:isopenicillin N synthase-like dioxygenase